MKNLILAKQQFAGQNEQSENAVNERIEEILSEEPAAQQRRILDMARALKEDRIKRALKWQGILGIKDGNRLVDDAKHLP